MKKNKLILAGTVLLAISLLVGYGTNQTTANKDLNQVQSQTKVNVSDLITQLPKESPSQFIKDYLTNYKALTGLTDKQLSQLLTNPDKYANIVQGKERAKAMGLKSVHVTQVKTLEQNNKYALVSMQYEFTFEGIDTPMPFFDIVLMGHKNGKWYIESDTSTYSNEDSQAIKKKLQTYGQQFTDSQEGQKLIQKSQGVQQKYQDKLQADEAKLYETLKDRQAELQQHQMIYPQ